MEENPNAGLDTGDDAHSVLSSSAFLGDDTVGSILGGLSASGLTDGTATAGRGSGCVDGGGVGGAATHTLIDYSSRNYHSMTARVYNTMTALIRQLRVPWLAFTTAMHYYHTFLESRGLGTVDCLLLGTTCLFLACKAENITRGVNLKKIIPAVFLVHPGDEKFNQRKAQIETVEMMLCQTLDFNFHVDHPQNHLEQLLSTVGATPGTPLHSNSQKFLMYAAHTPLCTKCSPDEVAEAVFLLVGAGLGMVTLDDVKDLVKASEERLLAIQNTVRQFLVMAEKKTGIPAIDAATKRMQRKRRRENRTPTPQLS